jgi:hypothetical protein
MQANDLPELERRLAELADAFGGRAPTKGALKVWMDALKECRFDDVQRALADWPKTNVKTPAPADILKSCRSEVSKRLEDEARRNAATAPTMERAIDMAAITARSTEIGRRELARIKHILSSPRPEPKEWARLLKMREEAGEPLDVQQRRL